ncbi:MAG: hypothetical protein KDD50_10240, partial [Bdellovibrionales bacterium]|nr:hypothetical protein [Bdellovibrionales bacterium]
MRNVLLVCFVFLCTGSLAWASAEKSYFQTIPFLTQLNKLFEKDLPSSNSGAFTYNIPLKVIPGRSGFGPQISINYNSDLKNGILGPGWSVETPYISVTDGQMLPDYQSTDQIYYSSKFGELALYRQNYFTPVKTGFPHIFKKIKSGWVYWDGNGGREVYGDTYINTSNGVNTSKWPLVAYLSSSCLSMETRNCDKIVYKY